MVNATVPKKKTPRMTEIDMITARFLTVGDVDGEKNQLASVLG